MFLFASTFRLSFVRFFFSYKGLSSFSSLDCLFVGYFSQNECPPSWLNSNLDSYIAYEKQKTLRIKENDVYFAVGQENLNET